MTTPFELEKTSAENKPNSKVSVEKWQSCKSTIGSIYKGKWTRENLVMEESDFCLYVSSKYKIII